MYSNKLRILVFGSFLLASAALAPPATAGAPFHPIVVDSLGNIYFVSLYGEVVLKRDLAGRLTVHASLRNIGDSHERHNLVLDRNGTLYVGQEHEVWRITPEGKLIKEAPPERLKPLFARRSPAALAPDGSVYEAYDRWRKIRRIHPDGSVTEVASDFDFRQIHTMTGDAKGNLFVADMSRLIYRIATDGKVELLQAKISAVFGMAHDPKGELLVLEQQGGIWRVFADGKTELVVSAAEINSV